MKTEGNKVRHTGIAFVIAGIVVGISVGLTLICRLTRRNSKEIQEESRYIPVVPYGDSK